MVMRRIPALKAAILQHNNAPGSRRLHMAKKPAKPRTSPSKSAVPRKTTKAATPPAIPAAAVHASKYAIGDHVSHPMFGHGTVTGIDGNTLTIQFADSGVKEIIEGYISRRKQ
jgi:hypothetical protein